MRRYLTVLILAVLAPAFLCKGQVIDFDTMKKYMTVNVSLSLEDRKDKTPISFASVYLIPDGDTTITHFALSDAQGNVKFSDVIAGKYQLNAEMIGYHPFRRNFDFNRYDVNLGTIRMEINKEVIDASTVTAVTNPITVKKDTLEYNASSYKVAEGAVLGDLLKRMPGMAVSESGEVTVNGERIDKITVGGKTFFFDDPSVAVKNLPAKVVEKIKVFDQQSEDAKRSGIVSDTDKKKQMDVQLKEEYKKGVFGNLKLGVGYSMDPRLEEALQYDDDFLYNGTAMLAAYGEKDQLTAILRGQNVPMGDGGNIFVVSGRNDDFDRLKGVENRSTAALNYSTDRIPGCESAVSVKYSYNTKDVMEKSAMTSFVSDGSDLFNDGLYNGSGAEHVVRSYMEVKNLKSDRYHFSIQPSFDFERKTRVTREQSAVRNADETLNSSVSTRSSQTDNMNWMLIMNGGLSKLGGKDRRTLSALINVSNNNSQGRSMENTDMTVSDVTTLRNIGYDRRSSSLRFFANLSYSEPLTDELSLNVNVKPVMDISQYDEDATDLITSLRNNYLSSSKNNMSSTIQENVLLQFSRKSHNLQAGLSVYEIYNQTDVLASGVRTVTGKDEWIFKWAPSVDYRYSKGSNRVFASYNINTQVPGGTQLSSILDVSDPLNITTGNIYLQPSLSHDVSAGVSFNSSQTYTFLDWRNYASIDQNKVVQASWFDSQAVRYYVPVNSRKPSSRISSHLTLNQNFGKKKNFTFSLSGWVSYDFSTGYQAAGQMDGIDVDGFDYTDFMTSFWGNASGDRFYNGKSGFAENNITTNALAVTPSLKYSLDNFSTELRYSLSSRSSRYSLNPGSNLNVRNHSIMWNAILTTSNKWEFSTDLSYHMYRGYTPEFSKPQLLWDLTIGKTFKSVTVSLTGKDIFNNTRNLDRVVEPDYVKETYNLVIGRHVLLSVVYNFGKMNAANARRANMAMYRTGW